MIVNFYTQTQTAKPPAKLMHMKPDANGLWALCLWYQGDWYEIGLYQKWVAINLMREGYESILKQYKKIAPMDLIDWCDF